MHKKNQINQQLIDVGRYMMHNDLAWGNAGNISAKICEDRFLITASGTYMGNLASDDFAECILGGMTDNHKKPSKEVPMHTAIYEERPDIQAVLHASPFYSTLIACSKVDIPSELFVESMYYLERIERVAYHHPGSKALGEGVREKAKDANILLLENHGVLVYDTSIQEARMALQTLEFACRMFITSKSAGLDLNRLPNDKVNDFLQNAGYKRRRKWEDI